MANPFIPLIEQGKITDQRTLKQIFRTVAKETHPDLADKEANEFVCLVRFYEEALDFLRTRTPALQENPRDRFFRLLGELENLELPINRNRANRFLLRETRKELIQTARQWPGERFDAALREYGQIKSLFHPNQQNDIYRSGYYDRIKSFLYTLTRLSLTGETIYYVRLLQTYGNLKESDMAETFPRFIELADFLVEAMERDNG